MSVIVFDLQNAPTCLKEVLEQLLDAVVSYTEPTGRLVSELFHKLPSKVVRTILSVLLNLHV